MNKEQTQVKNDEVVATKAATEVRKTSTSKETDKERKKMAHTPNSNTKEQPANQQTSEALGNHDKSQANQSSMSAPKMADQRQSGNLKSPNAKPDIRKVVRSAARSLVKPLKNTFGLSNIHGFCWIGFTKENLAAVMNSSSESPVSVPVRVLLVLFDGRRYEIQDSVPMKFDLHDEEVEVRIADRQMFAIRASRIKPYPEDALATLSDALRGSSSSDSDIFVEVSIEGRQYDVGGWTSSSEAKAYCRKPIQDSAAA